MATQVTFHKRVPQGSRGSLAELMARQAEAAKASTSAQDIQTPTIMQGLGKLGQIGAGVFNERRAAKAEASSREALAKLIAGVGEGGATQQQVADMGLYDQDLAEQYRREAVESRAAAAERANKLLDLKEERIYNDAREGRIDAREAQQAADALREERAFAAKTEQDIDVREAGQAATALIEERGYNQKVEADKRDYEGGIRIQERNQKEQDTRNEFNREYALKAEERKQALADAAAKPAGELGNFMADVQKFNNGEFGDPRDPEVQALFAAAARKQTAIGKGTQFNFDPETGAFNFEQGGMEEGIGGALGSTADKAAQAKALETYRAGAQAANNALMQVDAMSKALDSAGPTGPGGETYGTIDDVLEAYGSYAGLPRDWTLPGTSGSRAMIDVGSLAQQLENVQKTTGAISNAEMGIFQQASAGTTKTPEANRMIIDMSKAIIARAQEKATRAEAWINDPLKGNGRMDGFEQDWNGYINANPIISVAEDGTPVVLQPGQQQPQQPVVPDAAAPAAPAQGAADVDAILQELDAEEAAPPPPAAVPGLRERLERQRAGSMGRR